jgi:hypothetical protein
VRTSNLRILVECISQDQRDGFAAEALSKPGAVVDPDCQAGPLVPQIDVIEPDVSNQGTSLDDSGMVVVEQSSHPSPCSLLGHRPQIAAAASVHPIYFGIGSEPEAGREILFAGPAQRDPLACQNWKSGVAHVRQAIRDEAGSAMTLIAGMGELHLMVVVETLKVVTECA